MQISTVELTVIASVKIETRLAIFAGAKCRTRSSKSDEDRQEELPVGFLHKGLHRLSINRDKPLKIRRIELVPSRVRYMNLPTQPLQ